MAVCPWHGRTRRVEGGFWQNPEKQPGCGSEWHLYECGHNRASGRDPQWLPTTPLVLMSVKNRHPIDDRQKVAVGNLDGGKA